ncbi:MAG: NAD(P)H-hydrate dehydratase [Acidobacteria bacterium]|nr:NAD(P)H-hydrate dehydratase [Acidobacteriota bacterium]
MKIFTAQQMRELDRLTVERCGIPYATLMEAAGSRVVEVIEREFGPLADKTVAILCGKGNNGGDGAVIARLLWMRGIQATVYLYGKIEDTQGEARSNFEALNQIASQQPGGNRFFAPLRIIEITTDDDAGVYDGSDIVIDALFGTGLKRSITGLHELAVKSMNHCKDPATLVSIDIPSGLSSDSEHAIGPHVKADLTVSFTGPKIGNVVAPACAANGKLVIANIGTPEWLFAEVNSQLNLLEAENIKTILDSSRRAAHAHKNAVGDVLLIAGSRGKTGAAALAAEAVLRSGTGLVTVATAQSALSLLVTQCLNEAMTEPLAETFDGAIAEEAIARALQLAQTRTALAIGPGLSSSEATTREFVREFVTQRSAPIVIDADGLNALAPWPDEIKGSDELPIIITPHPGEMARLMGKSNAEIVADRIGIAREFAVTHHVITVLKGSRSLIAAPDGQVYVNPTGNAGMATAGSGDVLTGSVAGLLAQRPQDALGATIAAVYLHGLAGDLAAQQMGQRSLIASDLIANLSAAILQVGGEAERGTPQSIIKI